MCSKHPFSYSKRKLVSNLNWKSGPPRFLILKYKLPAFSSKIFLFLGFRSGVLASFNLPAIIVYWKILQIARLDIDFCIIIDWISLVFARVLCIIVARVLKFSVVYMENDKFNIRFTWLVLTFVFSMLCLIFIPHFFFLLIGWDGLGITSFLLVIYYLRDSSWSAGMKTYLINRVGDRFFIIGLVLFLSNGYWDINTCRENNILCLILVLGCFTKRAQFPFSSWLPAAMAAPTPVSSLVHSSTLVTAGIYVMIRLCHMFPDWLFIIIGIRGMWTLYSASLAACCEFDGKKVVAYSTLSQLGLMIVSISLKLPMIAFFHLITHAMFKALMFICVGYLIKKRGHFQDLRRLNGLWKINPLLGNTILISSLSLMGFPFLAGFFSKELILENKILLINTIFHTLLLLSLPFTAYYRCRLCFNLLKGVKYNSVRCRNDRKIKIMSILPLYVGAITGGTLIRSHIYSLRRVYPRHILKTTTLRLILLGVILRWKDIKVKNNTLLMFYGRLCYLEPFNGSFWVNNFINFGRKAYYLLDQGLLRKIIDKRDRRIIRSGEIIQKRLKYFLWPRAGYYISSIIGLRIIICICI